MRSESAGQQAASTKLRLNDKLLAVGLLGLIVAATVVSYSPVLFNFFNGDDFVHLTWLAQAIHHPELVWRNFYTSWLDGTTTKFYRPLISVFMVSDYALWGVNGLGFRLTNLLFHLSSTVFIYFIGRHLVSATESADENESQVAGAWSLAWPISAAALFALYPLHPEAVSWITGRVDSVVTAFCMAAVYFYMRYSKSRSPVSLVLCMVAAALGLLSKEMAITLPAVFLLYEVIYGATSPNRSFVAWIGHCIKSFVKTVPFWILLAGYFVVRYFALQTFVGGYDNSLLFIANPREFIAGWVHAIVMLLVPINKSLMGSHHLLSKLWPATLAASGVAAAANFIVEPKNRRHLLFLFGWLVLCLVPVYKLFNISDDLQGSRLAYLATVPLCMLLTTAMLPNHLFNRFKLWNVGLSTLMAVFLSLSGTLLWTNNQPWRMAGEENNAIRSALQSLYNELNGDPQVLFLGLPDQVNGAYTCRNSLDGMTRRPQLNRDIANCLMVNAFEPIFPFGYLKESIAAGKDKLFVYKWQSDKKSFSKIDIEPAITTPDTSNWSGAKLKEVTSIPEQRLRPEVSWDSTGAALCQSSGRFPQFVEFNLGQRQCFTTEFVEVSLELAEPAAAEAGADLLYSNDMYPGFELKRRTRAHFAAGKTQQRLLFALRGLPEWSFGGITHSFRLLLPANTKVRIDSIAVVPAGSVMPKIAFENSGYFGSKGYLHLGPAQAQQQINVDVSSIKGACKYCVETTRANLLFEEQNPQTYSKVTQPNQIHDAADRTVVLKYDDFRSPGIYEWRVFPLAEDGSICGAASDHIVISIGS